MPRKRGQNNNDNLFSALGQDVATEKELTENEFVVVETQETQTSPDPTQQETQTSPQDPFKKPRVPKTTPSQQNNSPKSRRNNEQKEKKVNEPLYLENIPLYFEGNFFTSNHFELTWVNSKIQLDNDLLLIFVCFLIIFFLILN